MTNCESKTQRLVNLDKRARHKTIAVAEIVAEIMNVHPQDPRAFTAPGVRRAFWGFVSVGWRGMSGFPSGCCALGDGSGRRAWLPVGGALNARRWPGQPGLQHIWGVSRFALLHTRRCERLCTSVRVDVYSVLSWAHPSLREAAQPSLTQPGCARPTGVGAASWRRSWPGGREVAP